jgi:hypothetical protein
MKVTLWLSLDLHTLVATAASAPAPLADPLQECQTGTAPSLLSYSHAGAVYPKGVDCCCDCCCDGSPD